VFHRMALTKLSDWFDSKERKPLIIRGARQTGKTTVVRMLAENIPGYMEVNLEAPGEKSLFTRNLSVDNLVSAIRLKKNSQAPLAESLLFLDEIQACPEAIGYLRFLAEQMPELAVIASGSLLEAYIKKEGIEFPVGRVEQTFIYPVTFSEYLGAMGRAEMQSLLQSVPFPDYALKPVYDEYVRYTLAGGMPEVVRLLSEGYKLDSLQHFYSSLVQAFQDDVPRYSTGASMRRVIAHCLESTPLYTGSRIKFAGFGSSNYRSREVGEAMRTLRRAMLLQLVYPTSEVTPPAKPNLKKHPKLFFLDSGLLTYSVGLQSDLLGTSDLNDAFRGILAEQQIAQTLLATENKTVFWTRESRGSSAEVDFLYQNSGMLVPIEVKSGPTGRLRSLHSYIDRCPHGYAVRFYSGPVHRGGGRSFAVRGLQAGFMQHFLCEYLPEYLDWFIREN